MKFSLALASVSAADILTTSLINLDAPELTVTQKFESFKNRFAKIYSTVEAEKTALSAFTDNDAIIQAHNSKNLSYWLGHNEFSDLSWDDFKATYVGKLSENPALRREKNYDYSLLNMNVTASAVDWVSKGAVTPVKNQGQCGSCWSFSTTGSVEGAFQIATGQLTSFSEEELVECDNKAHGGSDNGCNGGLMDNAFNYIAKNGICTEQSYPYTASGGKAGQCKTSCTKVATVTGHQDVPGEGGMVAAISKGPVSVAIEADKSAFQLYKGGVLDNPACGKKLDHGVLVVGFGTDGKNYYKIKNSWGASWGEKGYIRFVRNKDQCGVADSASYPTGAKKMGPGPGPGPAPDPAPGPAPGPGPKPSKGSHYEDPAKGGCKADEEEVKIQGLSGDFCSPSCDSGSCPAAPRGFTAEPQCALQSQSGGKNCALICDPSEDGGCGPSGNKMSCKATQGTGICTYND